MGTSPGPQSSMATLFLADGQSVNASCWAVKEPKSVIAKDFQKAPNLEQRLGRPSRAARRPQRKSSMEKVRSYYFKSHCKELKTRWQFELTNTAI